MIFCSRQSIEGLKTFEVKSISFDLQLKLIEELSSSSIVDIEMKTRMIEYCNGNVMLLKLLSKFIFFNLNYYYF